MTNRSAYVFRRTIPRGKFTLTSKDLFFYRTYSKVITDNSVGVVIWRCAVGGPYVRGRSTAGVGDSAVSDSHRAELHQQRNKPRTVRFPHRQLSSNPCRVVPAQEPHRKVVGGRPRPGDVQQRPLRYRSAADLRRRQAVRQRRVRLIHRHR